MSLESRITTVPVTPEPNAASLGSVVLRRERAATRIADDVRVVCATGWSTSVHQLSGATRVVWEALDRPQTTDELARSVGVDASDPFFMQAVGLLIDAGLFGGMPQGPA